MAATPEPIILEQEIIMMNTADLIPYVNNARVHDEAQVTDLASMITEFRMMTPILVDANKTIIAGHCRLLAAQKLGIPRVPTLEATHMSPAQQKAYIIADNRIAERSTWDKEKLAVDIQFLQEQEYNLDLTGFGENDIESLFASQNLENDALVSADSFTAEDEEGSTTGPAGNPIIQYNLVFDTIEQQERFYGFMRFLRSEYPDIETMAGRLDQFLQDNNIEATSGGNDS